ncbi:MAG: hypothetical protein MZV70_06370 [Desulfobacterales bacterium]|nr:hypothetical protein [Desulfobacterales bacterium]
MEPNRVALKTLALAAAGVIAIEGLARWGIGRLGLAPLTGTALARLIDIAWMALVVSGCPQGWARIGLGRGSRLPGLGRGLIWSAGFGALAALGWAVLHAAGIDPLRLLHPGPGLTPGQPGADFPGGRLHRPGGRRDLFPGLDLSAVSGAGGSGRRWP